MIIYFADRKLNILGHASTTLPAGYRIYDDLAVEDVETGVNTFEGVISYTSETRSDLEAMCLVGNYVLKQSLLSDGGNTYDSLFQIIETEFDTKTQEMHFYAEDAGLELINTICGSVTLTGTLETMMRYFLPSDWVLNLQGTPTNSRTYEWDGESTATERLMSVANLFGCELYYSFFIDRLVVSSKVLNVIPKRGNQIAIPQLRLNYDLDRICTKKTIADLVTAYNVIGGKPEGVDEPINLKGYSYSYTDYATGDVYQVDPSTGQMRNITAMARWGSVIDSDGLWVGSFEFDTTDKAVLAGQARAQLQKESQIAVNYEVDFSRLPDNIRIGDRINIIDEQGELYLEARVLRIETCASDDTQTATIGEYILRNSGISEKVAQLAQDFANLAQDPAYTLEITSSDGDVFKTTTVATTLTAHVFLFGTELSDSAIANIGTIKWYNHDDLTTVLGTGKTYTITEAMNIDAINVTARLES
jgi:hypothetical protein